MSKKIFKKMTKLAKVIAFPGRVVKDKDGNVTKVLYNIYKLR